MAERRQLGNPGDKMNTFEEFQTLANKVPLSLRNNLDRINLPATGLQNEAGRIGALLADASATGRFILTPEQRTTLRDRLSDLLWHIALLCDETGISMQETSVHCLQQLQERAARLDPERR